jgi:hypothetical protein
VKAYEDINKNETKKRRFLPAYHAIAAANHFSKKAQAKAREDCAHTGLRNVLLKLPEGMAFLFANDIELNFAEMCTE